MASIVTLTLNPTVDKSTTADQIIPDQKLRCAAPKFEPGGGGINVSRALKRLGADSVAVFPVGGPSGQLLRELLTQEQIQQQPVETVSRTRENFIVVDARTGQQYRFGMPGTELSEQEQQQVLTTLRNLPTVPDFLVISGSLPPGVEPEFLVRIVRAAKQMGIKVVVDTSGPALHRVLEEGVYLAKPNVGELSKMAGVEELDNEAVAETAQRLVREGKAEILVVSLGPQGACVVTRDSTHHVPAPAVKKRSTVGAGDSMVAGLVYGLSTGLSVRETARLGVACGTAATMNPGTELFRKADVDKLYQWLLQQAQPGVAA
ncbi:1-phosphofructokinase family hexose kinase [Hymenobacter lutimineralis]|uniref:1-phosphofructokinase family hexose kinase n=1 Tax=Hymenobacter lutimineralis TaxID=2606448 RepID=A0A5D6V3H1_9BACT|nr:MULTISPECIES: 1-phosphofructokinase family hexose kinase [Hymenobacter]QIX62240.1 1-phosphofructokinase family hexose kinase [Hymenobacter sp. BT18]TYZ10040.1 1-phosphofructokinase family hexose kinase [Hymenobacter lutimineralis]